MQFDVFRVSALAWLILPGWLGTSSRPLAAEDPFALGVRTTDPLPPMEQRAKFHLPPGFEIQLVATEPDLNKPFNLAFDPRGRLWVTTSIEYPFAAPTNAVGRDRVMIFEDFGGDGRARKVTPFADGLNIPIGVYPLTGIRRDALARMLPDSGLRTPNSETFGNAALVWSIPHIWLMDDTDGDGRADRRVPVYGPFDYTRDTHGNQASFRRGFDGWLYATHGFNNDSRVRGADGHEVHLNSGNTYRMRLDGARLEPHTWGQVNPFGLAWDAFGNLYSSDCHSAPVYQLLAGGYYPSFGKPHDGLGFAPVLMEHAHGSTAIDGIVYYVDDLWPDEFQKNTFIGNVMTSRLNRDRIEFHGSSPRAIELPDFLRSDDPWFRPVDNQLGPDGALYIADFYNRIIGHYEVPLTHPGRDRERGRIWRVVYTGNDGRPRLHHRPLDLTTATAAQLIAELADPNLTWRMLAMHQLCDRTGTAALGPLAQLLDSGRATAVQHAHALWALARIGDFFNGDRAHVTAPRGGRAGAGYLEEAARHADPLVRTHALRIMAELPELRGLRPAVIAALSDSHGLVQRCAAEVLGRHPRVSDLGHLLALRARVPAEDTHLLYVVRKAMRDVLKDRDNLNHLRADDLSETDSRAVADVATAIPSPASAAFLIRHLERHSEPAGTLSGYLRHAARHAPEPAQDALVSLIRRTASGDLPLEMSLMTAAREGIHQRGGAAGERFRAWAADLATRLMDSVSAASLRWWNSPVENMANTTNPWFLQQRTSSDGNRDSWFLCSLPPGGEALTGILRSEPFVLPARLEFFIAGHDGYPDNPPQNRNFIRLKAADSEAVLAHSPPPRNDVAQPVAWDLAAHAGRRGYVEIVDGDNGNAYAWLAAGRFHPPVIALPAVDPSQVAHRQLSAAELARAFEVRSLEPQLAAWLGAPAVEVEPRAAAARALLALDREDAKHLPAVMALIQDASSPLPLRARLGSVLMEEGSGIALNSLMIAAREAPYRLQAQLASALATRREGAEALLLNLEAGKLPPRLLQERSLRDKLLAARPDNAARRIEQLTAGLPPAGDQAQKLIDQRRAGFDAATASAERGRTVFGQACSICHRLGGAGGLVGPQLDGIGHRGLERLLEDILDPNRNVDRAFRSHTLTLKDGEVLTGLPRREEGELLIIATAAGVELSVPQKEIAAQRESETSLMPENFGDALTPEQLHDLLAFLLASK